jgi:hypothetical protein
VDLGRAVHPDPPQRRPVVVVVVDDEPDAGVAAHVVEAREPAAAFGLDLVHHRADEPVHEREGDRHQPRGAVGPQRGQSTDGGARESRALLRRVESGHSGRHVTVGHRSSVAGDGPDGAAAVVFQLDQESLCTMVTPSVYILRSPDRMNGRR